MKTLIKSSFLMAICLMFTFNAYSQQCLNHVSKYSGPQNTQQLAQLLATSTNPVITGLSTSMIASLENLIVFATNGEGPSGMSGVDDNITSLYENPNYGDQVFSAIFGLPVYLTTYANEPTVTSITYQQFVQMTNGGTIWSQIQSLCTNCYCPIGGGQAPPYPCDGCCEVTGHSQGCIDNIVVINGNYYHVQASQ